MIKKNLNIFLYIPSLLWSLAGFLLLKKGFLHLIQGSNYFQLSFTYSCTVFVISIVLGLIKYQLIFKKIVSKQLKNALNKSCFKEKLKNFFPIKRFFFIVPMIFLSKIIAYLIKEPFYTSPLKIGIGFALVLSSIIYAYSLQKNLLVNKKL